MFGVVGLGRAAAAVGEAEGDGGKRLIGVAFVVGGFSSCRRVLIAPSSTLSALG